MAMPEWKCYAVMRGKHGLSNCVFVSWEDAQPHIDEEDGFVRGVDFEAFPDLVSARMWMELCRKLERERTEKAKEVEDEVDTGNGEEGGEEPTDDDEEEEEPFVGKRRRRKKDEQNSAKTKDGKTKKGSTVASAQGGRSKAASNSSNVAIGGEEGSDPQKKRKRGEKESEDKVSSKEGSSKKTASTATVADVLKSPKTKRGKGTTTAKRKKDSDAAHLPSGIGDTESEGGSRAQRAKHRSRLDDAVSLVERKYFSWDELLMGNCEEGREERTDERKEEEEPPPCFYYEHDSAEMKDDKTKKGNTVAGAQRGTSKATSKCSNVAGGGEEESEPQKNRKRGETVSEEEVASKGGSSKKTASTATIAADVLESSKSNRGKRTMTAKRKKKASDAADLPSGRGDTESEGGSPAQRAKNRSRLDDAVSLVERKHFSWEERITQLKDYQKQHGHCNVHGNHPILGDFVREQRKSYREYTKEKASSLTAERIKELTDLGLELQKGKTHTETSSTGGEDSRVGESPRKEKDPPAPESPRGNYPSRRLSYEERIEQLQRYKEMYGDLMVGAQFANLPGLGSWVKNARKEYKKFSDGKRSTVLNFERVEELEEMGFVFQPKRGRCYSKRTEVDDHNSD